MSEFAFTSNVTIGQYVPGRSFLHALDPRVKLLGFAILALSATFVGTYLGNVVLTAATLWLVVLSRLPLRYVLGGLRPALPFLVAFLVLQLLFGRPDGEGNPPLVQWSVGVGPLAATVTITPASLRLGFVAFARLLDLVVLTSLLTLTTPVTRLSGALEDLLAPLARLRLPVQQVAMVFTIALRFVPTLAEELEHLMKAQASRGADFGRPGPLGFVRRTRQLVPILVPLFVGVVRRADELALAMEARCYFGGQYRRRSPLPVPRITDWATLTAALAFGLALLLTPWPA